MRKTPPTPPYTKGGDRHGDDKSNGAGEAPATTHDNGRRKLTACATDGGGDAGLVNALYDEMTRPPGAPLAAPLASTAHSHLIGFAAEESRLTGRVVDLAAFRKERLARAKA